MFLLRTLFWLCVIISFLPADEPPSTAQLDSNTRVSASSVMDAARITVTDISSICERSPRVCETGKAAFHAFVHKARYGAKLVYELMSGSPNSQSDSTIDPQTRSTDRSAKLAPPSRGKITTMPQGTLQPSDLVPTWSGPTQDRSA